MRIRMRNISSNTFIINIFIIIVVCIHSFTAKSQDTGKNAKEIEKIWEKISPCFYPAEGYNNSLGSYRSPLKFYNGDPVETDADWKRRRKEILSRWNEMLGEWPSLIKNQKMLILETSQEEGFVNHRVKFNWLPGKPTEGYLLIPEGKGKKPAVVIVFYEPETAIGKGKAYRDFAYQLVKRGFVTLSIGTTETTNSKTYSLYYPDIQNSTVQPLSVLAYAAANVWYALSKRPEVDRHRIGIMGHSYGGKWSCIYVKQPCASMQYKPSTHYVQ